MEHTIGIINRASDACAKPKIRCCPSMIAASFSREGIRSTCPQRSSGRTDHRRSSASSRSPSSGRLFVARITALGNAASARGHETPDRLQTLLINPTLGTCKTVRPILFFIRAQTITETHVKQQCRRKKRDVVRAHRLINLQGGHFVRVGRHGHVLTPYTLTSSQQAAPQSSRPPVPRSQHPAKSCRARSQSRTEEWLAPNTRYRGRVQSLASAGRKGT